MIKIFTNFVARLICNFKATHSFTRSGSLAFTILLSFVPFTISMVSLISMLPVPHTTVLKIQHKIFMEYLPPNAEQQIYHQVKIFLSHSQNLSIMGVISLLITTYLMIFAIEEPLDAIWHNTRKRNLGRTLLTYTLFLVYGLILSATVSILQVSSFIIFSSVFVTMLNQSISFLITLLLFVLVYKTIPCYRAIFKNILIAATAATIIFFIIKILFMFFLVQIFVNYHVIYGSLSVIPIFLLWIYLSCLNLFFGAGIIYALETKFDRALQHKINRSLIIKLLKNIVMHK